MAARKKKPGPRDLERAAKRAAQKAAGAFDGRFRSRVVRSRKTYTRKRKHPDIDPEKDH